MKKARKMPESEDLKEALNKAREMELEDKSLNFRDEFLIAPQVTLGKSVWAKWLENGYIKPFHILWAFEDINPRKWLAVRVEVPDNFTFTEKKGKVFYFNLQSSFDRWKLKQLETELKEYFEADKDKISRPSL